MGTDCVLSTLSTVCDAPPEIENTESKYCLSVELSVNCTYMYNNVLASYPGFPQSNSVFAESLGTRLLMCWTSNT